MRTFLILAISFLSTCNYAYAQMPVATPPTSEDAAVIRELIAERNKFEAESKEYQRQAATNAAQSDAWKALYFAEKDRADKVLANDVVENLRTSLARERAAHLKTRVALTNSEKALAVAEKQIERDGEKLRDYEARIRSLKSQRPLWFFAGAAAGGIGGYWIGSQQNTSNVVVSTPAGTNNFFQVRVRF